MYSGLYYLPHPAHAGLHDYRDNESGKPLSYCIHAASVFWLLNNFPIAFSSSSRRLESDVAAGSALQMVGGCQNYESIYRPQHGR